MIPVPSGVRVWLAVGRTDMRRAMNSRALPGLKRDLFVFRGARGDLIKILPSSFNGLSTSFEAYEFPEALSFKICFSSERSATSRLRRVFSFPRSFMRFACSGCKPRYFLHQRYSSAPRFWLPGT